MTEETLINKLKSLHADWLARGEGYPVITGEMIGEIVRQLEDPYFLKRMYNLGKETQKTLMEAEAIQRSLSSEIEIIDDDFKEAASYYMVTVPGTNEKATYERLKSAYQEKGILNPLVMFLARHRTRHQLVFDKA